MAKKSYVGPTDTDAAAMGRPTNLKSAAAESDRATKATQAAHAATEALMSPPKPGESMDARREARRKERSLHNAAQDAHARAAIAAGDAGDKKLERHHSKLADLHMDAVSGRGGTHSKLTQMLASGQAAPPAGKPAAKASAKALGLKAFASEGKKEAAPKMLQRGKKGGTFYTSAGGRKVYTKK